MRGSRHLLRASGARMMKSPGPARTGGRGITERQDAPVGPLRPRCHNHSKFSVPWVAVPLQFIKSLATHLITGSFLGRPRFVETDHHLGRGIIAPLPRLGLLKELCSILLYARHSVSFNTSLQLSCVIKNARKCVHHIHLVALHSKLTPEHRHCHSYVPHSLIVSDTHCTHRFRILSAT
jgi:hypothetical protein